MVNDITWFIKRNVGRPLVSSLECSAEGLLQKSEPILDALFDLHESFLVVKKHVTGRGAYCQEDSASKQYFHIQALRRPLSLTVTAS